MNQITPENIALFNSNLRYESPEEVVSFAIDISKKPLVTTSFGAYSAAILHVCSQVKPDIPVIWCDTGYNTEATYRHVQELTEKLNLNLEIFTPKYTTAFLDSTIGRPDVYNPNHRQFSEKVKLEPFKRAFAKFQPDIWFANIRNGQTSHRKNRDTLTFSETGILKVSPFYHYTDSQLLQYLKQNDLPVEFDYHDPVKAVDHRECGIHLQR